MCTFLFNFRKRVLNAILSIRSSFHDIKIFHVCLAGLTGMQGHNGGHEDYPQHGARDAPESTTSPARNEGSGHGGGTQAEQLESIDGQALKWGTYLDSGLHEEGYSISKNKAGGENYHLLL